MEEHSVAHLWRSLRDRSKSEKEDIWMRRRVGAMEKEAKEWGNQEQRATLNTLRVMFPQVDIRILKGTVLESNEIDAAVEFILTEVLEQPSTGKVDERLAKELISGSSRSAVSGGFNDSRSGVQTSAAMNNKRSAEVKKRDPFNAFDLIGDFFNVGGSSVESGSNFVDQSPLVLHGDPLALRSGKAAESSKLPAPESLPIDIPIGNVRTTEQEQQQESFTYEFALKPHYTVLSESLTESEPDSLVRHQDSGRSRIDTGAPLSEFLSSPSIDNSLAQPRADVKVKDDAAYLAESLYGSVLDLTTEADYAVAEVGTTRLEDLQSDEERPLQKHINSKGSRWAYDSDDDYSDMQDSKSSLLAVPSGQFDEVSRYSGEGSRLMESSVLEETYDGLFITSADSVMNGSSQVLGVDALDELVNGAKSDKDALVAAIEEMRAMRAAVEEAEATSQQAKKDAMNGGLDVLADVKEMQAMLVRAREVNEMHAGEVYGEKAVLETESLELQRRLAQLKAEREKAFLAVQEMRATLQGRIDHANGEREAAETEKRLKEESARSMLAVEEEQMAKVAQESRDLDAEEEACTKLRDFLINRGSVVDSLQGEMAIISEDVEVVKKQLDEGILFGENSFLQMLGSRSLSNSVMSGKDGSAKLDDAGNSQFVALSQSGSSYQSATRAGEGGDNTEDLSNSELAEAVSGISLTNGGRDAEESQRAGSAQSTTDSGDDEGWQFLETSSARSNKSPIVSPNSGKRIRSE